MIMLHRYWFTFPRSSFTELPQGILIGCGITAYSQEDAINILQTTLFKSAVMPEFETITQDVDISTLDGSHILPNMGDITSRGIWFPLGYPL